ncbi:MAG: amino acid adenylation domain-containing protein [Myxococcota bacterium]
MSRDPTARRHRIADMYPLSPMQRGLLFHSLLEPDSGLYMPHVVLRIRGTLDVDALRAAFEDAVADHPVLRTGVFWEERDEPFQVVFRDVALPWSELDWREEEQASVPERLEAFLAVSHATAFELKRAPLHRVTLIRERDAGWTLVWAYHHLILDGWSAARVLEQVFATALLGPEARAALPPSGRFGDYVAWLDARPIDASEGFWRAYLGDEEAVASLPFAAPATGHGEASSRPRQTGIALDELSTRRLRAFAESCSITVNTLVMGTFALLMGRYGHARDVRFGKTVTGRPPELPGASSMVGLFLNTVPVAVHLAPDRPVGAFLEALQRREATSLAHEHVPLRQIQAWTNEGRSLFDCLFVFEGYPAPRALDGADAALSLEGVEFDERTHFPLLLQVAEGDTLRLSARYDGRRFGDADVTRLLGDFERLLLAVIRSAETPVGVLSPRDGALDAQAALGRNAHVPTTPAPSLLAWFEAAAARFPDRTAVRGPDGAVSYAELHARANGLAEALVEAGLGADDRVALHLERSIELIVGVLGTLKAGAAFLPLDPVQPRARLEAILAQGRPRALLRDAKAETPLDPASIDGPVIDLPRFDRRADTPPADRGNPHPAQAAYAIFTSGSTGTPKGVVNGHGALLNRLAWMQDRFPLTEQDVVLHKTSIGFDVSVWELTWPFLVGATLALAEPGRHGDVAYLERAIPEAGVTTMHFVPSMLRAFLEGVARTEDSPLRRVICSGEALTPTHVRTFAERFPGVGLFNLYGPTEAAIDVTAFDCADAQEAPAIPIGRPIDRTTLYVLDTEGNPVAPGTPGELHISGAGLARGYLDDPRRTAEAFVPNPFARADDPATSPEMYRTGDLARFQPDGELEYLGRIDQQMKVNGIRIEPGEIESALRQTGDVAEALVLSRADDAGVARLTAYLVRANGATDGPDDEVDRLRAALLDRLPPAMVPSRFVFLPTLPLLSNGKVDRRRLPAPEAAAAAPFAPPRNATERLVADVWREVLGVDEIGVHDDFMMLGGHSLNATRVNARLRKQLDLALPLTAHFRHLTIGELALHIDALRAALGRRADASDDAAADHVELEF